MNINGFEYPEHYLAGVRLHMQQVPRFSVRGLSLQLMEFLPPILRRESHGYRRTVCDVVAERLIEEGLAAGALVPDTSDAEQGYFRHVERRPRSVARNSPNDKRYARARKLDSHKQRSRQ